MIPVFNLKISVRVPRKVRTETWREHVTRRQRCNEIRKKLAAGEVHSINDLITYNLDIRQCGQDVIENSEGPELLRAFWHAMAGRLPKHSNENHEQGITVLDPTCGSGAFLFAALNILEPLYEACLERMQAFIDESSTGVPPVDLESGTGILPVDQCDAGLLTTQPGGTPGPQYFNPWAETRTHTRKLPHWEQEGATYFLTFRLADSLPQEKVRQWREERDQWLKHHPEPWNAKEEQEFHSRFTGRLEEYSDAG